MSDASPSTVASNIFPRAVKPGFSNLGPAPNNAGALPVVTGTNLPPNNLTIANNLPPNYPSLQQSFGLPNSIFPNTNYALATGTPPPGPNPLVSAARNIQNEANQRRLTQLEDENVQRRSATATLQQMGIQILQGQMDIQEQVLQYQFMLEQCMETLDHQNLVLSGQAEEMALLRSKMRNFENLLDAFRQRQEKNAHLGGSADLYPLPNMLCNPSNAHRPVSSGLTRVTSSKFQPFNVRYRSPTNERRTSPPATTTTTTANPNRNGP